MEYVTLVVGILEEILSIAGSATTGQTQNIINIIGRVISTAGSALPSLEAPLTNIISALSGNGSVTAEQIAQLQAQSAALDAGLDAAGAADGLM